MRVAVLSKTPDFFLPYFFDLFSAMDGLIWLSGALDFSSSYRRYGYSGAWIRQQLLASVASDL